MSWNVFTGPTDRDKLWNAIDLLKPEQEGADPEALAHQAHHAKAAAKCVCNAFDVGEYPQLSVRLAGHIYGGPRSSANWCSVTVESPAPPVSAAEAEEAARAAATESRETTAEAQTEEQEQTASEEQPNLPETPSEQVTEVQILEPTEREGE